MCCIKSDKNDVEELEREQKDKRSMLKRLVKE